MPPRCFVNYTICYPEQSERRLDAIRQQSHLVSKKVHGCVQGSGATVDKHQVQMMCMENPECQSNPDQLE